MAKNVTLLGASYTDVPAVDLPQTGGGTATFTDVSDTTATTSDVMEGTYFYNASGQRVEGELTSGGGRVIIRDTTDSHGGTIRTITSDEELYIDSLSVTDNGTYTAPSGTAYDEVSVTVQASPTLQTKSVNPSETAQTVRADNNYDGLEQVNVGAISSSYVGSGITRRDSSSLQASGATVTVPAGYYESQATKSVTSGSVTGPSSLSASSATVSTGTNTLTLTKTGVTTTPTVTAGYVSSATASTASVSLTANVTTKSAATITPGTTDQTIASGTYLTGAQTISGDANLVAGNIKKDVSVFGTTGTYEGSGGGGSEEKSVFFIDYDGTVLYEYTATEAQALSSLPSNPNHTSEGLTAQGWNWTLPQIKSQITNVGGEIMVGATYSVNDGNTHVFVYIPNDSPANQRSVVIRIKPTSKNGVTIDWGDGNTSTTTSTSATNYTHNYSATGEHEIIIQATTGTYTFGSSANTSNGSSYYSIYGSRALSSSSYGNGVQFTRIRKVFIGGSVTGLDGAFYGCHALEKVVIGTNAINTLSSCSYAFYNCYGLRSATIAVGIPLSTYMYELCTSLVSASIPHGITELSGHSFSNCYILKHITIPSSVTTIGSYSLYNCNILTSVNLPSGLTTIENYAFYGCYSLPEIEIPSNVTSIGDSAFDYCYSFSSIEIPSSVTTIGSYSFANCYNLSSVEISNNIESVGNLAFQNCYSLVTLTIPDTHYTGTSFGPVQNCRILKSINIPTSVTTLNNSAFNGCSNLESITIPNGVTTIDPSAFNGCTSLSCIDVPSSVTTINASAFANCYGVAEYHFRSTTPPTLSGTNVFSNIPINCTIYVPTGYLSDYQTANYWSTYASKMVEE